MITAVATIVLAFLTAIYVWLTHKLLRAQSDPYVVLFARPDELRPGLIELVIENLGNTVARDVRFEFSRPMFWKAWGTTDDNACPGEPIAHGPLVDGIPALAPREMRRIPWGQPAGLRKALGDGAIVVTTRFRGSGSAELPRVVSRLDVKSFATTDIAERDPTLRLVGEVRRLREAVESLNKIVLRALDRVGPESGPGGKASSG